MDRGGRTLAADDFSPEQKGGYPPAGLAKKARKVAEL